ncbi:MAG: hypothetical protein C5B50_07245 [Verrucomicrobia bacterium]|nr:MAG: hypothetical protein C5B50_07245 [Verrucomicrobiota bacterium]
MKKSAKTVALLTTASVIALTGARAQNFLITVDELGNGTFNGAVLPSSMKADPFSGMVTLAYQLPFAGNPGDVQLFEPNTTGNLVLSDVVRFDGQGFMYFFSELEPGELNPDPADVPQFPPPLAAFHPASVNEVGPEGNNNAIYTPTPADPGGISSGGLTYNFISDVPEPSASLLALLGMGLMMVSRRVRRAQRS